MRELVRHLELILSAAAQATLSDHGATGTFSLTVEDFDASQDAWPVVLHWTDGAPLATVEQVLDQARVSFTLSQHAAPVSLPLLILPWRDLTDREQLRALHRQLPAGAADACARYRAAASQHDPSDDEREQLFLAFDELTVEICEIFDRHDPAALGGAEAEREERWLDTATAFLAAHPGEDTDLMLPISDAQRDLLLMLTGPDRHTVDALV